jgi:tetratricopeptide (TPR) repeat protein
VLTIPNVHFDRSAEARAALHAGDERYAAGDFAGALRHHIRAVQLNPNEPAHHCRVGFGLWHAGRPDEAVACFQQALVLRPDHREAHEALGQLHMEKGRIQQALHHARTAAELAPDDRETVLSLAYVLEADRQTDVAWQVVERLLEARYESPRLAVLFARIAPRVSRQRQALELVECMLANGKTRFARETSSLHFLASDLLDKLNEYDRAFAHARQANAARNVRYDAQSVEPNTTMTIGYFTRERLGCLPRMTNVDRRPVFIVGMPRSGTSLVEQILAAHPDVHGAGELTWLQRMVEKMSDDRPSGAQVGWPFALDRLSLSDLDTMASGYLQRLSALAPAARCITDKMPSNFLRLGLIAVLFPQARIIHCRRNPLDTCLSCYFTDFATGNEFSFDLASLGHQYRQYERLMAHWANVLDLPILDVTYEQLVADVESHARSMVKFVGLEWDERCLRFHETKRTVATASLEQVRRPIYRSSVERWRNYDQYLAPLRAALSLR